MIARLVLTDFRNHGAATLAAGAGLVVLTGENGAGKTNILEAISLLAPGRGLRGAPLGEVARSDGPGGFAVHARLQLAGGPVDLATGTVAAAPERRIVRINGAAATATALAEWLSVLWLTPAMDRLFVAPASERRRFLDRLTLALSPAHAHHAARYEAAMRARNRLLADEGRPDPEWLAALETAMAEHGVALDAARRALVTALAERIRDEADSDFPRAGIALDGWDALPQAGFAQALREGRRRDAAAGRALLGPHRSDLLVAHRAKAQPAALASTGEQKALLFGMVLAHAALVSDRTGRPPILLLDEVAAHLDARRRAALFQRLSESGGQVWMTGTEAALFADVPEPAIRFRVGPAGVVPS